jgi:hypothetical protein
MLLSLMDLKIPLIMRAQSFQYRKKRTVAVAK